MGNGKVSPESIKCVKDKLQELGYSLDEIEHGGVSREDLKTVMTACNIGRLPISAVPVRVKSDGLGASVKRFFGFEK